MSNISRFSPTDNEIDVFYIKSLNTCPYSVYFKSKTQLNYSRFVDQNIFAPRTFESTNLSNFVLSPLLKSSYMSLLAVSALFEYLSDMSTAIIIF